MDFLKQNNFRYIVIIIIIILAVINLCKINSQENFMNLLEDQNLGIHTVRINSTDQVIFGDKTLTHKLKNVETGLLTLGTDPTGPFGMLKGENGLHLISNRDVFLMSPGDLSTVVSADGDNSGKLVVEGRADFREGAFVKGHLSSESDSDEGGRISLINPRKYSDNTKAANWIIYNMTGGYLPNGLHFWRESGHTHLHNNHINRGSSFVLTDDGDTLVKGDLTVEKNTLVNGNLTCPGSISFLPRGCVIMFSGSSAPGGWAICDGGNGTPDLRGRFVLGSGKPRD